MLSGYSSSENRFNVFSSDANECLRRSKSNAHEGVIIVSVTSNRRVKIRYGLFRHLPVYMLAEYYVCKVRTLQVLDASLADDQQQKVPELHVSADARNAVIFGLHW